VISLSISICIVADFYSLDDLYIRRDQIDCWSVLSGDTLQALVLKMALLAVWEGLVGLVSVALGGASGC
jgi:hypothetical protein